MQAFGGGIFVLCNSPQGAMPSPTAAASTTPPAEAWVYMWGDGTVTAVADQVPETEEIREAFHQIVSDELTLPSHKVKVVISSPQTLRPNSSTSPFEALKPKFKEAATKTRWSLQSRAAERWQLSPSQVRLQDGKVWGPGGQALTFEELLQPVPLLDPIELSVEAPGIDEDFGEDQDRDSKERTSSKKSSDPSQEIDSFDGYEAFILLPPPEVSGNWNQLDLDEFFNEPSLNFIQVDPYLILISRDRAELKRAYQQLHHSWLEHTLIQFDLEHFFEKEFKDLKSVLFAPHSSSPTTEILFELSVQNEAIEISAPPHLQSDDLIFPEFLRSAQYKKIDEVESELWCSHFPFSLPEGFNLLEKVFDRFKDSIRLSVVKNAQSDSAPHLPPPYLKGYGFTRDEEGTGFQSKSISLNLNGIEISEDPPVGIYEASNERVISDPNAIALNVFCRESLLDKVAQDEGRDALSIRYELLVHESPDWKKIFNSVKRQTQGWQTREDSSGRSGRGLAVHGSTTEAKIASVAWVHVPRNASQLYVEKLLLVIDAGFVPHPEAFKSRIYKSQVITFEEFLYGTTSGVQEDHQHRVYSHLQTEIILINRPHRESRELTAAHLQTVGPAIANAILDATGETVSKLPLMSNGEF